MILELTIAKLLSSKRKKNNFRMDPKLEASYGKALQATRLASRGALRAKAHGVSKSKLSGQETREAVERLFDIWRRQAFIEVFPGKTYASYRREWQRIAKRHPGFVRSRDFIMLLNRIQPSLIDQRDGYTLRGAFYTAANQLGYTQETFGPKFDTYKMWNLVPRGKTR